MRKLILGLILSTSLTACTQGSENYVSHQAAAAAAAAEVETAGQYADRPSLDFEELSQNSNLPGDYPSSYIFAHNMSFYALLDGNINIIDVAADSSEFKGMVNAGQFATFAQAASRNEFYVAETYYSRGTHGKRTDVLTIYDNATLDVVDEIILPTAKRLLSITQKGALQIIDNDKLLVVSNFTPASSVTLIDLDTRKIVSEIPTPGCMLTFPLQGRAFASLCGNGAVSSYALDGTEVREMTSEPFNDISDDPMFMKSEQIEGVRYFPTYKGNVRPIKVSGTEAIPLEKWSLISGAEKKENWRPSGWQVVTASPEGRLFVIMQKGGREGSHDDGGSEVWVFDVESKKKIRSIKLKSGGISIEVTKGNAPLLVVTNHDMMLDVYSLEGEYLRTILVNDIATPFALHASK